MTGINELLLVLAPPLAILFLSAVLIGAWLVHRSQRFLLWQACAYTLTALALGAQTLFPFEVLNRFALLIGSFYLLSAWCLGNSWAQRWRISPQPQLASWIAIVALISLYHFCWVDANEWGQLSSISLGCSLVLLLPILRARTKTNAFDWLDKSLLWLSIILAIFTLTQPVFMWMQDYSDLRLPLMPLSWTLTLVSAHGFALLFTFVMSAIAAKQAWDELSKERNVDGLTQLPNRCSFRQQAHKRIEDSRYFPLAMVVCAIDHFKQINDSLGHKRGDKVLQFISATLQEHARERDLVARFDGEKFAMLLTEITQKEAKQIAHRIRRDLATQNTVLPAGYQATMSFGIATFAKSTKFEQAMTEAEQLLCQAKNAGRDQIRVSGADYPDPSRDINTQRNKQAT
ncbi:hypothetical protein DJFAAGMI_01309 [Comamonas sp. PE63]|uniref:diguanylate cyclase n=1 Tax=Comamonas brasiliensis TaxID=1812482 RepID=A0ABS5LR89_9BURK|nr:GGDEF domain-containing protein [Comamonas sp. PE63]MBS3018577.1 hypothetical protein [Comamonas sp. PE63]